MMTRLLLACVFCLIAAPSWAAVTYDTKTSSGTGSSNTTSHSHTFAANSNLAVIIVAVRDGGSAPAAVTSVTVGGQAATLITGCATNASPATTRVEMWAKVSPLTGAQTVAVDASSGAVNDDIKTVVLSFIGAATTNTFGTCVTLAATTAAVDLNSIGSAVGEMGVLGLAANAGPTCAADATAPVSTEREETTVAGNLTNCAYTEDGAATSINMLVDLGSSQRVGAAAVSIRAARTGGGGPIMFQ